ncbi:hypothetical protein J6590_046497 [Homalodisca vitripennis]|nr:hypothetical protein J6590_046497 [Homalodisca vitripennis]
MEPVTSVDEAEMQTESCECAGVPLRVDGAQALCQYRGSLALTPVTSFEDIALIKEQQFLKELVKQLSPTKRLLQLLNLAKTSQRLLLTNEIS